MDDDKKGILIALGVIVALIVACWLFIYLLANTPPLPEEERLSNLRRYNPSEAKFCASKGLLLHDHYHLHKCPIMECTNTTHKMTYNDCGGQDGDDGSFVGGLLVGMILFG